MVIILLTAAALLGVGLGVVLMLVGPALLLVAVGIGVAWLVYLLFGGPTLVVVVLLVVIIRVTYLMLTDPARQLRKIHRDAERDIYTGSASYINNVRRTVRR